MKVESLQDRAVGLGLPLAAGAAAYLLANALSGGLFPLLEMAVGIGVFIFLRRAFRR